MRARLALAALLGFLSLLSLGGHTALAGPPPAYFVTVGVTGGDIGVAPGNVQDNRTVSPISRRSPAGCRSPC